MGASVSTKQLARAAAEGRKITFTTSAPASEQITGYLVGMDDYHFFVAAPVSGRSEVDMVFVHKSAPFFKIGRHPMLDTEPEAIRADVENIGGHFIRRCRNEVTGRSDTPTANTTPTTQEM